MSWSSWISVGASWHFVVGNTAYVVHASRARPNTSSSSSSSSWLPGAAAVASAIAGVAAAIAAALAVRQQRHYGATDAFLRVADGFEREAFRKYRAIIYNIDRNGHKSWTDDQKEAVNAWCAHLDLVAVLVQSKEISTIAFLNLYGDVVLRTIYQVAPYCNAMIENRGKQFLLPTRLLTGNLVKTWRRRAARRRYPLTIGFPSQPQIKVNPDLFDSDDAVLAFRVDRRFKS